MLDPTGADRGWWPDWSGATVAVLAGGPSLDRDQIGIVSDAGWRAIAINETWAIAPWAGALYGCDWTWWRRRAPEPSAFRGIRITGTLPIGEGRRPHLPADMAWQAAHLHFVPVRAGCNDMLWQGPQIGAGSNSAFQAVNLAARWGARRIALLGVDCHSPGQHWHGAHDFPEASRQRPSLMERWRAAWRNVAPDLAARGVEVVNCAPGTACDAFRRLRIDRLAMDWREHEAPRAAAQA